MQTRAKQIEHSAGSRDAFRTVQYRRNLRATRDRAFEAVVDTLERLRYPRCDDDPVAGELRFSALARRVSVRVLDAEPGCSTIVLEFAALRWLATGGSAAVILPGVLLGAVVKAQDAYFARGFLDNVQRVLESKPVGRDSARLPGMNLLREKLGIGEH